MNTLHAGVLSSLVLAAVATLGAQGTTLSDSHLATARAAAERDFTDLFDTTCGLVRPSLVVNTTPARPAVKVFDNLYFVGQSEYSAWAVTTSEGIILMDAIFDYSVEAQVIGGLTKLGLDPTQIKYVVISHAHGDHVGGAKVLQDRGARIVMSAADWELMERATVNFPKPRRDVVAVDGQKLTLGDTTITLYVTPGHTMGTLSSLIPVRDGQTVHPAIYWGGTAFNWVRNPTAYVTPQRPASFWFDTYARSAQRARDLASRASATVVLSNHTKYDRTFPKLEALRTRVPGRPHPFVVGTGAVQRFLTVAEDCARSGATAQ
jgi:metallo-beta-lactamase class B